MLRSGFRAEKLEEGHVLSTETNRIRLITQESTRAHASSSRFYARDEPGKVRWNDVKCMYELSFQFLLVSDFKTNCL